MKASHKGLAPKATAFHLQITGLTPFYQQCKYFTKTNLL